MTSVPSTSETARKRVAGAKNDRRREAAGPPEAGAVHSERSLRVEGRTRDLALFNIARAYPGGYLFSVASSSALAAP